MKAYWLVSFLLLEVAVLKLYLVQHGEAKREEEDPSRPLTDRGWEEAKRVAGFLAKAGVRVDKVFHSGKLRALQTAQVFADALKPSKGVEQADALDPLADPRVWADRLRGFREDLMLVGHLPHLSKLASLLLAGREDLEVVKFRMAGVVCLERDEVGKWSLLWAIRPELLA
ncbi:MAG: phosphohistidine phosphatase SixA [Candidatus Methanomethylicota archaeon]|uniref:Phosphohistidine phosphatase SixA n=1 Tax=Thermoproteota archaeon TaxID=2056631 RepID=A0A497F089_9CREN|nr:MAG: phosphohistidine phosphatase SixA [Candidatus Verstraetearchaeota archaeon]